LSLTVQAPAGLRARAVSIARIDAEHANPAGLWRSWGAPEYLSAAQVAQLQGAAEPMFEPVEFQQADGALTLAASLAPQSANLLRIEWIA
jgi:hypothetical protein